VTGRGTQNATIARLEQRVKWLEHELQQAHFNATHDELTGLPNRTLFRDRLERAVKQAKRHRRQVGLLFVDIDGFKRINDRFGHLVGDKFLQQAAQRLVGCMRDADTVSRIGGDEFMVLLPEVDGERGTADIARKLEQCLAKPHLVDGFAVAITASIGSAIYPDDSVEKEGLIRRADAAMYAAKAGNASMQVLQDVGA
jgi:diguanylate cyclase (GGDEF)-like protein